MSWVYCAPKSRIRTREEWMSAWGVTFAAALFIFASKFFGALRCGTPLPFLWRRSGSAFLGHAVVRRFLGDLHVVHVALAHAGPGDAHELRIGAHGGDAGAARVAHGGAQATRELMNDGHEAALVRHASFDAFGHELLELRGGVLEIAIGRAVALSHGAERTHAAVRLV